MKSKHLYGSIFKMLVIVTIVMLAFTSCTPFIVSTDTTSETTASKSQTTETEAQSNETGASDVVDESLGEPADARTVDIIEITDFHAQIQATNFFPVASALYQEVKKITGASTDGSLLTDGSLVLGCGDLFDVPPMSKELNGLPTRYILERIGMEMTALGNHEFYWDMDIINNITLGDSQIQILCCNLLDTNTNELFYEPYKIYEKNGVKIAIISAAGKETLAAQQDRAPEKFIALDPVTEINKYAAQIREGKMADVVLAVVHDGGNVKDGVKSGEIFELAKQLQGIDALYAGHSHKIYVADENGIDVLGGGKHGEGFIHTRITVSNDNSAPVLTHEFVYAPDIESDPELVELDSVIESIIAQAHEDTNYAYFDIIGTTEKDITKDMLVSPYGESELGNFVTDAMKDFAGTEAAIHSHKQLHNILTGNVTTTTLANVSRKCKLWTLEIPKSDLKSILENTFKDNSDSGVQVSGLKIKYDMTRPEGDRIVDIIRGDGTAISDDEVLFIAINGRATKLQQEEFGAFDDPKYNVVIIEVQISDTMAEYLHKNNGEFKIELNNRIENINMENVVTDNSGRQ